MAFWIQLSTGDISFGDHEFYNTIKELYALEPEAMKVHLEHKITDWKAATPQLR